jgi:hypothetical protein
MQSDSILQLLTDEFAQLGAAGVKHVTRTAIFHGRHFVGHLFRCEDLRAVWFVDTGVIRFYDARRTRLRELRLWQQANRAA